MKEKQPFRLGMGASSLMMILVVLCLTTLGVLAYASARAEARLETRTEESVTAYYQASALVQAKLARLDADLAKMRQNAATEAEYQALITESGLEFVENDRSLHEITEPLGDGRVLKVGVRILRLEEAERYRVVSYALTDEYEWVVTIPDLL